MSLARVKDIPTAEAMVAQLDKEWTTPFTFLMKEIYFTGREGENPFDVREVVPFGACPPEIAALPPYFGPNTYGDPEVTPPQHPPHSQHHTHK